MVSGWVWVRSLLRQRSTHLSVRTIERHFISPTVSVIPVTLAHEPFATDPSWSSSIPPPVDVGSLDSVSWSQFRHSGATDVPRRNCVLLDVRTPAEFALDHISGAINVPVLNDAERAHIGELHSKGDVLRARFEGAALICSNLSPILKAMGSVNSPTSIGTESMTKENETIDAQPSSIKMPQATANTQPPDLLIYCWRGGQRSNSLATLLTAVGWPAHVGVLVGGYRSWRRLVLRQLDAWPRWRTAGQFWVVAGLTGSGKSLVLSELANLDSECVLDLEELADHKGSLFGAGPNEPHIVKEAAVGQRQFESRLHARLTTPVDMQQWSMASRIWIECESRSVGPKCRLSDGWWQRLRTEAAAYRTHRVWLDVPEDARVAWIVESYSKYTKDPVALRHILSSLAKYHPQPRISDWQSFADRGDYVSLVTGLLRHHYDPLYKRSRGGVLREAVTHGLLHRFPLPSVDRETIRRQLIPLMLELSDSSGVSGEPWILSKEWESTA